MIDLYDIAARLEADVKFKLVYKIPVNGPDGNVEYETREGKLLDVAEDAGKLFVSYKGKVIWVMLDEIIELTQE